ncbi:aldehyde dehydrogenase (AldH12), putative [Metarhizium acridum CQMa 102]|uniref:Aldehyde dehydrogenase (AldH12), putative n=1 Tax=Metarhizium acridum (strain CQMa 102) TaxID=655827 RepID=E9DUN5_METAQ|nr:aldehyde dehydrogenase (AldH12), putative [Metarhizium acridum CQMa 102]EFY92697.1 aldehyde dehydrogenase (AldH12), putative [Metarhizium acridum CQMa 102]
MAYEHRSPVAADIGKHISLELGGKNPNLIFEDVDMGKAAPLAAKAAFENSGQICLCGSRIYIQRSRHEEFLPGLIRPCLALARKESATFHLGSVPEEDPQGGYWTPPVMLTGLSQESRVIREEIFGPVVTVSTFETEDEAVALANDDANGLAAVVMTNHVSRMRRAACWRANRCRVGVGELLAGEGVGDVVWWPQGKRRRRGGSGKPYFRPSARAQGLANYPHACIVPSANAYTIYVSGTSSRRGDGTFVGAESPVAEYKNDESGNTTLQLGIRQKTRPSCQTLAKSSRAPQMAKQNNIVEASVFLANVERDYRGMNDEWNRVWPIVRRRQPGQRWK